MWSNSIHSTTNGNICQSARALTAALRTSSTTASYTISLIRVCRETASLVAPKQRKSAIIKKRRSAVGSMALVWAVIPRRDASAILAGPVQDAYRRRSRPLSSHRATSSTHCLSNRTNILLRCNSDSVLARFTVNSSE